MNTLLKRVPFLAAAMLCCTPFLIPAQAQDTPDASSKVTAPGKTPSRKTETPAQYAARMKWFDEARFGMFIHWGLYSVPAGEWNGKTNYSEWISQDAKIPMSQYEKFADEFNPTQFDAKAWVKMAKDTGMKYIVVTSCHHDGFSMYPSKVSDWSLTRTPFKRDPLKELATECKKQGLRLCFYHTIMDWHSSDYAPRRPWNDVATGQPNMDRYRAYLKAELKELLTNYGPIGILWFDGEWENTWTNEMGRDLEQYVRSLQPDIIINNRLGKGRDWVHVADEHGLGDYGTPEQHIPPTGMGPGVHWESCMTMGGTWGYNKSEKNWKSNETLIRNMVDIASKGGNYLLNVGPTADGVFPGPVVERLNTISAWMKTNSESIYGTSASPFKRLAWGRATQKSVKGETTLYLHVFNWPQDGKLVVPGLKTKVLSAKLLATKQSLSSVTDSIGVTLTVPTQAPDAISSTIALKLGGPAQVETFLPTQNADGTLTLAPEDATTTGGVNVEAAATNKSNFGFWTNPQDTVTWTFKATKPGPLEIRSELAAESDTGFTMNVGLQKLAVKVPKTGSYSKFETFTLGTIDIPAPGTYQLKITPLVDGWQPVNMRELQLKPVK